MRVAGLGTWLVAIAPTALAAERSPRTACFAVAAIAFLVAFSVACRTDRHALGLRVAQSIAAIAMVWFGRNFLTGAIFVVVAAQLPGVVASGVAAGWIVAQAAAIWLRFDQSASALANAAAFAGFQAFGLAAASVIASERRVRAAAAEHARTLERLRVARDLHDTLGHHLTALGMQLDVATRLADGRAKEHVERAHAISRLLLADVREAVHDLREPRSLDDALRALAAEPLAIHLELADALAALTGERADAIARCAQEAITNTVRHANARNLWLAVTVDRGGIRIRVRDDGQAREPIAWGHGLTGMRERFATLGGTLAVHRAATGGLELEATLP